MTLPRRLRPSSDERQLAINKTAGVLSARGGVPSARPVAHVSSGVTPAPTSGGASILATVEYGDFSGPTIPALGVWEPLMSDFNGGTGDFGTYFGTDGINVIVLVDGYYSVAASSNISGLATGDDVAIGFSRGAIPSHQAPHGEFKALAADAGVAYPWCGSSTPIFMFATDLIRPYVSGPVGASIVDTLVFMTRWA